MNGAGSVRGPLGGWEQAVARGGERIRVEVSTSQIAVVVEAPNGEPLAREAIPHPTAGCAGHELLLSPTERYLAMFLYSGQSEVGYELFCFRPRLEHIYSFGYVSGEGFGPVFSTDERCLALAWTTNPLLCLFDAGAEQLPTGEYLVEWVRLRIQTLPDGSATTCTVRLRLEPGFPLEGNEALYPEDLEITSEEARFRTAWGEHVRVARPLPGTLIIRGPTRR